ncbi:hypothetical protein ACQ4PT_016466 [Festuca glaucescens]
MSAENETPRSRRWSDMVEEEELASSESSSRHSYSDVVRDSSPSPVRAASPKVLQGGCSVAARAQPARRLASVVSRPVAPWSGAGGARHGYGRRRGPQPKRQRHRGPLPSLSVPVGMPAGLAGLCFNCAEPGHVAGVCEGPRCCLNCKSEEHVARQCPPVAGAVAHGAPPPPPPPEAPPASTRDVPPHSALATPSRAGIAERGTAPAAPPSEPYRIPAHLRMGTRDSEVAVRPSFKERLGARGAGVEVGQRDGGGEARPRSPLRSRELEAGAETPFARGLHRERELRDAPPLRQDKLARGESSYIRGLHREQELHSAALASAGIAHEGEVIGEEALEAYLSYFEKTMSEDDLTAYLALFGWLPSALPLAGDEEDVVV